MSFQKPKWRKLKMLKAKKIFLSLASFVLLASPIKSFAEIYGFPQVFSSQDIHMMDTSIKTWTQQGMILNTLSCFRGGNKDTRYAGSFKPSNEAWFYALGLSGQEFATEFSNHANQGFKIKDFSVCQGWNDGPFFAGLWEPANGLDHAFYYGMTDEDLHNRWVELVEQKGFRVDKHVEYNEAGVWGKKRHAVSYVKDNKAFYFLLGMSDADFKRVNGEMSQKGFALEKVNVRSNGNSNSFSATYLEKTERATAWYFRLGTPLNLQNNFSFFPKVREMSQRGYQLESIAVYNVGREIAAVWKK
jgi:hypothetical protein